MSTEILTTMSSIALIVGLLTVSIVALYRHRLAAAALAAAAACAAAHVVLISLAWEGVAGAYLDAPLTVRRWEVAWPPISSLSTMAYDATAWVAMVLLATGIVLAVIERHRRKVAEKEMAKALMHFFGANKDDESEED